MSKESNSLRLLGSPVNLSYRSKKKDDKRNIRNRPRSALQSTVCVTPVNLERYKRPFSADTKDRAPSTRSFLKSFSAELLQSYNNSSTAVRIVAPTTDLLRDTKSIETDSDKNKVICSNLSDYGSEDTFISLGTKIKTKAQLGSKNKINSKNFVKYRNLAKKARKPMENTKSEDDINQEYGLQVKIIERDSCPNSKTIMFHDRSINPADYKHKNEYEIFQEYVAHKFNSDKKDLGHESYSDRSRKWEEAMDARCLNVAKEQLSLVEEESTQDLDSLPSQHLSSLPLEFSIDDKITKSDHNRTYPIDKKSQWTEPLNHSRLLYKDFFLKKEGHIALPPQNSPNKSDIHIPGSSEVTEEIKPDNEDNIDYPPYLINSTTKAYTSKVIEDYKKELEAINNLHDLTIKDIKTDAVSPTPLNIDKMFEDASHFEVKKDSSESSQDSNTTDRSSVNKNSLDSKQDISKISTKELIQNYLKVKEGDYKNAPKITKKSDRKPTNGGSGENASGSKQEWNNKSLKSGGKSPIPVNIRNQTQKNMFTMPPRVTAWVDGVQNDKDVDSWMSLSAPSPRVLEIEKIQLEEPQKSEPSRSEEIVEIVRPPSPVRSEGIELKPPKELGAQSTVLDIYSMLKEIESYGENPVTTVTNKILNEPETKKDEEIYSPKDNFMEIFEFLEKVEQSANDALSVVTNTTPQTMPKLETLLKLPQTELAQRLVTASLQLEERSCCIALLQESLANHKEQMISKVSNLEKQSIRNINKVKQECEETIKRHQNFIDQLINDKKTLNHRIEQLVDERRTLEERWKRSAQALEERYKLELRNQHDKMQAAQQVARQRWVRQKAEKIKELTVKGLEGELREMAERQQKEISDLKMTHAEQSGRIQAKHAQELEDLRRMLEEEKEAALVKERHLASSRLEKQILEIELTYQEQRTRLVSEMRAENERVAAELAAKERAQREEMENWREEQENEMKEKRKQMELEIAAERQKFEEKMKLKDIEMQQQLEEYKKQLEVEQQVQLKRKVSEISAQHKQERDKEIERAIESMEAEAQAGRRELQDMLRRTKEQYEAELKELAETEQATLRRYQDAQARVRQTEDKCAELEVTISQLETRNRVLTEKNTQLEARTEEIKVSCEETWKSQVDVLKKEMEEMKKTHEEQMHQLYAKVKVAVARKDSAIQALTRESAKYQEKITLLEQKLQQQRKDFLKQK